MSDTAAQTEDIDVDPQQALSEASQVQDAKTAIEGAEQERVTREESAGAPMPGGKVLQSAPQREIDQAQEEQARVMAGADQAAKAEEPEGQSEEEKQAEAHEILVPMKDPRNQVIGIDEIAITYTQRPLSFIGKMQFFSLIGNVLDKAMSGENPLQISSLFDAPQMTRPGDLSLADFRDAEVFMQAVGKLVYYAPDLLERCFCIWLAIPEFQRQWAREVMAEPADQGGISDDDAVAMVETFIDQNWGHLEDFFVNKIGGLRRRIEAQVRDTRSRQSRRSKTSAPVAGSQ